MFTPEAKRDPGPLCMGLFGDSWQIENSDPSSATHKFWKKCSKQLNAFLAKTPIPKASAAEVFYLMLRAGKQDVNGLELSPDRDNEQQKFSEGEMVPGVNTVIFMEGTGIYVVHTERERGRTNRKIFHATSYQSFTGTEKKCVRSWEIYPSARDVNNKKHQCGMPQAPEGSRIWHVSPPRAILRAKHLMALGLGN
ncbi:hypothetical protein Anapl_08079 [Anas platyrhynchos]|uniref:Uncharacterized protein n=1 Tax=Anas platyrhynchos TaxID=8839 RepID=R0LFS9_ANAPL|nr:hypothetical protein Anapl_08079 [Anas platyrhynchos]